MTVQTSVPFGVRAGRRMAATGVAARHVIDVHRRKAALGMMRVPKRQLLAAVRRAERVVNVEDLHPPRLHGRAELIEERRTEPRRFGPARRVLQAGAGASNRSAMVLRFCTMAARWNPSRAPERPLKPQTLRNGQCA